MKMAMTHNDDGLDIPAFLRLTADERKAGWARHDAARPPSPPAAPADRWREAETTWRAARTERARVRIEKLKAHKSVVATRRRRVPLSGREAIRVIKGEG